MGTKNKKDKNCKTVALLVFDDVEVLDVAGPFEVFSVTNELNGDKLFDINIVAEHLDAVRAKNGLSLNPDKTISDVKKADFVIIPGGDGVYNVLKKDKILRWLQKINTSKNTVISVCTGALILAEAGLLEGLKATTHRHVFEKLDKTACGKDRNIEVIRGARFIDNENKNIITSAGISAGIDMSFHVIEKFYGSDCATNTALYMEYDRCHEKPWNKGRTIY